MPSNNPTTEGHLTHQQPSAQTKDQAHLAIPDEAPKRKMSGDPVAYIHARSHFPQDPFESGEESDNPPPPKGNQPRSSHDKEGPEKQGSHGKSATPTPKHKLETKQGGGKDKVNEDDQSAGPPNPGSSSEHGKKHWYNRK